MCDCEKPAQEYQVGTGAESFWHRRTNTYPGCTCPAWRYNPMYPKPTDPNCKQHGEIRDVQDISATAPRTLRDYADANG